MKFCELIKHNSWPGIKLALLHLYPGEKRNIVAYEKVYNRLIAMDCASTDMMISVDNVSDKVEGDYVDVSGIAGNSAANRQNAFFAIEFCSWKQWMGMQVAPHSLLSFAPAEIIAHCIYKMTFLGFAEGHIHHEHVQLNRRIHDLEAAGTKRNWFS